MAKFWKEPLDASRHRDHFHAGGASGREPLRGRFSYFVEVAGFTVEFASVAQIEECLAFFETRIRESSRTRVHFERPSPPFPHQQVRGLGARGLFRLGQLMILTAFRLGA